MQPLAQEVYRQMLLSKRAVILSALRSQLGQTNERVAEEDQGTVAHEEFVTTKVNRLDYAQLCMIDEALDRMESGDYGVCLSCEEQMPLKRLTALPWARYCVPCQERVAVESSADERPYRLAS